MPNDKKPIEDFDPNIAAALSYLLTPITGVLFFAIEKKNNFVRFHAFQSILFGIVMFGSLSIANSLNFILIGYFLRPIFSITGFVFWLLLMWKAYNNEEYELPYLGKLAKDQVYKK